MTTPKFPTIVARVDDADSAEVVRSVIATALRGGHKPSAAKEFLSLTTPLAHDRSAIVGIAENFVSILRRIDESKADQVFDLANPRDLGGIAVVAWRRLEQPGGGQDRAQGAGPPSVTAHYWMVTVDEQHKAEPLDRFMARAAAAGWSVTSSTLLGTVEQNSSSETWLAGLNMRDTRFGRVLTQMLFLSRDVPAG